MPKEHKVAPRWKRSDYGPYTLAGADGELIAEITPYPPNSFETKVRNRRRGWVYAWTRNLAAAKRAAKKMMEEEAR